MCRYQRANVFLIPTGDLHCDPVRFQFRVVTVDKMGSSNSLKGVRKWDDTLAGTLLVWVDPANDRIYIVNGHNRYSKAISLGVTTLKCEFINAETYQIARSIGALKNISEGHGTPLDIAKFIRDSGKSPVWLVRKGKLPDSKLVRDGISLSKLNSVLFDRLIIGDLTEREGVIIGSIVPTERQNEILPVLGKLNNKALEEFCHLSLVSKDSVVQEDLFGNLEIVDNALVDRAKTIAEIRSKLTSEKRLFSTVARNSSKLEKGNNTIDTIASKTISDCASTALTAFDLLKLQSGQLADLISDYRKAPAQTFEAIVKLLSQPSLLF